MVSFDLKTETVPLGLLLFSNKLIVWFQKRGKNYLGKFYEQLEGKVEWKSQRNRPDKHKEVWGSI